MFPLLSADHGILFLYSSIWVLSALDPDDVEPGPYCDFRFGTLSGVVKFEDPPSEDSLVFSVSNLFGGGGGDLSLHFMGALSLKMERSLFSVLIMVLLELNSNFPLLFPMLTLLQSVLVLVG